MQKVSRLKRELELMLKNPPSGISCTLKDDNFSLLDASIVGLEGTAYEAGVFKLEIQIPEKYPFEPPQVKFLTPVYHPNIDSGGRICLDLLKVGKWKATITLSYLLMSIRLLLAEPNPSDPLVAEIAEEFLFNRPLFDKTAREWTKKHACLNLEVPSENAGKVSQSCGVGSEPTKRKSWQMEDIPQDPNASKFLKRLSDEDILKLLNESEVEDFSDDDKMSDLSWNPPGNLKLTRSGKKVKFDELQSPGRVKVYLLLTRPGEENTTLLPIVLSSNFPENISLNDLLRSVPDYCKVNLPHLGIETGVSANVHNHSTTVEEPFENKLHNGHNHSTVMEEPFEDKLHNVHNHSTMMEEPFENKLRNVDNHSTMMEEPFEDKLHNVHNHSTMMEEPFEDKLRNVHNHSTMMEEPFENKSHIYRKHLDQFSNKSKHLNGSAVNRNRTYNQSIILKPLHSKVLLKFNKTIVNNSELQLNYSDGKIDNQSSINKSLAEAVDSKNDTRDGLEENHTSSNISQGVVHKKLHIKSPVKSSNIVAHMKSSNIVAHSSQHKLSNNNETINNENSTKKNLSSESVLRNVSEEEVHGSHDVRDVYYVVHSCSEKKCRIHQVMVLKRGTVQEEDMEAILKTVNRSQYSSPNRYGGLEEWLVSFSAVISGMLLSNYINIQWLLPVLLSLSVALIIILICRCDINTYKKQVEDSNLFMEETMLDIKELTDIMMDYTTTQQILERRLMLNYTKETDHETQINKLKNEIAHLKILVQRMEGNNSVNMDDFITGALIYLENCLESAADTSDESQQWLPNEPNDLNSYGQLR